MYSCEDFEWLFIRYKGEAYPKFFEEIAVGNRNYRKLMPRPSI